MNAAVERRGYITQLSQGALAVLGIGIATDRVEAYEVSRRTRCSMLIDGGGLATSITLEKHALFDLFVAFTVTCKVQ